MLQVSHVYVKMWLYPRRKNLGDKVWEARKAHLEREGWKDVTEPHWFTNPRQLVRIFRILYAREEELLITSRLSPEKQEQFFNSPLPPPSLEVDAIYRLHEKASNEVLKGMSTRNTQGCMHFCYEYCNFQQTSLC